MISSSPRDHRNVRPWRRITCDADAVPLPLDLPRGERSQLLYGTFERIRQAEWIRAADDAVARMLREELPRELRRRLPIAHQPVRDRLLLQAARARQRSNHQVLRDAHTKLTGDQLVPDEPLRVVHLAPRPDQRIALRRLVPLAHGQQPLLDPPAQALIGLRIDRRRGRREQQGDRFRHVAHRVVAFAEQPLRDRRLFRRPVPELAGRNQALRPPPDQEMDRPGRVLQRRAREVARQRFDFPVRFRRRVQRRVQIGEGFHLRSLMRIPLGKPRPARLRRVRPQSACRPPSPRAPGRPASGPAPSDIRASPKPSSRR